MCSGNGSESEWTMESDDDSDWRMDSEITDQSDAEVDCDTIVESESDDSDNTINLSTDSNSTNLNDSENLDELHYKSNTKLRATYLKAKKDQTVIEVPCTTRNNNEDKVCPICLELCTCEGEHCVTFIRCGHLFGDSCIRKWFLEYKKKKCPLCNTKSNLGYCQ